jgi:hypothetical protein
MFDLVPTAVLIPSLGRSHRLRTVVQNIRETTPEPHKMMFCVGDPESKAILDELGEWYFDDTDDADKRYVTRMNKLVRGLRGAKTVFFGSDDVLHHSGWLSAALRVMVDGASVVVVNDMRNRNGTQALVRFDYLTKAVFDDASVAFHPGYLHNFADSEMFYTAHRHGAYARAYDSYVEHLHPIFQEGSPLEWDKTYTDAMKGWEHDEQLFEARMKTFDAMLNGWEKE